MLSFSAREYQAMHPPQLTSDMPLDFFPLLLFRRSLTSSNGVSADHEFCKAALTTIYRLSKRKEGIPEDRKGSQRIQARGSRPRIPNLRALGVQSSPQFRRRTVRLGLFVSLGQSNYPVLLQFHRHRPVCVFDSFPRINLVYRALDGQQVPGVCRLSEASGNVCSWVRARMVRPDQIQREVFEGSGEEAEVIYRVFSTLNLNVMGVYSC